MAGGMLCHSEGAGTGIPLPHELAGGHPQIFPHGLSDLCPAYYSSVYTDYKGFFSMMLQSIMDHQSQFTHMITAWLGKVHNAKVFRNSR